MSHTFDCNTHDNDTSNYQIDNFLLIREANQVETVEVFETQESDIHLNHMLSNPRSCDSLA